MKIVLSIAEVKKIVLDHINTDFVTAFNEVVFDGYSNFTEATVQAAKPEVVASTEVL